ncbi:MAG TPA: pyridoxal-phosphate dependent enzyme [Rhodothermales bacterium]
MWHDTILGTIGDTPLVRLNKVVGDSSAVVLAKVEYFNPGGSVKDRIGYYMIDAAEREGTLRSGGTIIEGTSGNTGVGLALAAISRGYKCIFTTTDKQSQEKIDVLRALGAEVIVCPTHVAPDDPRSYYSVARRLAAEIPNSVYLNQYDNLANTKAHYETTGPEIWRDTDGRITHFVCGAGTGGTISGVGRYLKEQNPAIKVIGVDPFGSVYHKYFHEGVFDQKEIYPYLTEGVGEDILAGNMDFSLADDFLQVSDRDAMLMTRRLAREEGLFVGQSSGMAVSATADYLSKHPDEAGPDAVFVVLLPDTGYRYLSKTYNDNWMRDHGFLRRQPDVTVQRVLSCRQRNRAVVSVSASDTLGTAIERMNRDGISQLPVIDGDEIVGSLTETVILNRLIEQPNAREAPVRDVMDKPFPVVPRSLHLDHLSAYLEEGPGAVLVEAEDSTGFDIITKSDLISALAYEGRNGGKQ